MDKQMDEFLSIGMEKYRGASATLVSFGKEVEKRLHAILSQRRAGEWGRFVPDQAKLPKSTKYWSEYPLLNANIAGRVGGAEVKVFIAINWYASEREYPFYFASLDPVGPFETAMAAFNWSGNVKWNGDGIQLDANEDDFALERDFGILLNELVRFLSAAGT